MSQQNESIDAAETLIAHLLCAENDDAANNKTTSAKRGVVMDEVDAGAVLRFPVMRPSLAHTFDLLDGDRNVGDDVDEVQSLVFFPKSPRRRTTLF